MKLDDSFLVTESFISLPFIAISGGVINQSIPLVLPVKTVDKERLQGCAAFTLKYEGKDIAILRKPEFYPHNKEERCGRQFGTTNLGHPYVKVGDYRDFSIIYNSFFMQLYIILSHLRIQQGI